MANSLRRTQRGSASAELAILVPMFVLLALTVAAGSRLHWAQAQVQETAAAAARAATVFNSAQQANTAAREIFVRDLASVGVHCTDLDFQLDSTGFALLPGEQADVHVTVRCELSMADLAAPGLPGSFSVRAQASERIDTYRSRRP